MRGYAICASPRSGTNYLCQLLASTGALGVPREYFNAPARRALEDRDYPDDPSAWIERVLRDGATPNGIYGLKLFPDQLALANRAVRVHEALAGLRHVRLKRRDILGQALSWARALQTGQYRSTQTAQDEPRFDGALILDRLGAIARDEASWDVYFARTGIATCTLYYEDVAAAPDAGVAAVADWVGVADAPAPRLAGLDLGVQRDVMTEVWRVRFLREFGDPGVIHRI